MLKNMTESRVTLSRGRTVTHYTLSEVSGVYTSLGGDTIAKISDGITLYIENLCQSYISNVFPSNVQDLSMLMLS